MKGQNSARWSRDLATVFGLGVFALLLVFLFSVNPVYAPEPDYLCVGGDDQCGGGGGGGPPPLLYKIDGYVVNFETGASVPNMPVYLYTGGAVPLSTTTDSSGFFRFSSYLIGVNSQYVITVNGLETSLGYATFDCHWGQMAALVHTDSYAYGYRQILLQRSATVEVPAAVLFSNTKYATLVYKMTGTHSVSHTMTFSVSSPISASVGYTTSTSFTATSEFKVDPSTYTKVAHRYYAATYWDDRVGGVSKAGLSCVDISWMWDAIPTSEYLTTDAIPYHAEQRVMPNVTLTDWFTETGSTTWNAGAGVPFAIQYVAFGATIDLDTTVTATATNTVGIEFNRHADPNPNVLTFWMYTRGTINLNFPSGENGTGGFELHVWDYSGAG